MTAAEMPGKKAAGDAALGAFREERSVRISTQQSLPKLRSRSNKRLILEYMVAGNSLTTLEAFNKFRCTALHSVISELNQFHGIVCDRKMVTCKDSQGHKSTVARYWLSQSNPGHQVAAKLLSDSAGGAK